MGLQAVHPRRPMDRGEGQAARCRDSLDRGDGHGYSRAANPREGLQGSCSLWPAMITSGFGLLPPHSPACGSLSPEPPARRCRAGARFLRQKVGLQGALYPGTGPSKAHSKVRPCPGSALATAWPFAKRLPFAQLTQGKRHRRPPGLIGRATATGHARRHEAWLDRRDTFSLTQSHE